MRPLRLLLEGFGSYREPTDVSFDDVDFFALVGPTGSGKSTVIDALCFALYGTVPRWGKGNMISLALAPSQNRARVCLVFDAFGGRYAAARLLTRDARGQVHTKEARLDRLDESVSAEADLTEVLAASVEQVAEGSEVTGEVEKLLGLSYEHFTQCVLLPQGKFAEFLQAKPSDRQDLLVELLAYGVYAEIGRMARGRASLAHQTAGFVQSQRDELTDATEAAETAAADRLATLTELVTVIGDQLTALEQQRGDARAATAQADAGRRAVATLAALVMPDGVSDLTLRIDRAQEAVLAARGVAVARQAEADAAADARESLGDERPYRDWARAFAAHEASTRVLTAEQAAAVAARAAVVEIVAEREAAEERVSRATEKLEAVRQANAAAAVATHVHVGEACPVCLQTVTVLPHHDVADLGKAQRAVEAAAAALKNAGTKAATAERTCAAAEAQAASTAARLTELAAELAEAPSAEEVTSRLTTVAAADVVTKSGRDAARAAHDTVAAAELARRTLDADEHQARDALNSSRDQLVPLGAPQLHGLSLAEDWQSLLEWAERERAERAATQINLDALETSARQTADATGKFVMHVLAEHDIAAGTDPADAQVVLARASADAEAALTRVRADRDKAAGLDKRLAVLREEQQVAAMLGNQLQAQKFERWLCGEALDALVAEASGTLMELSGGQYELDRTERNELVVIDYNDAGTQRPVHTLSGGETFQASLALALALSRQVVELSAGRRELDSMFLDEGFGTLDDTTLDTVASTLEALASDGGRMVGVITHVPALAERVPVRFQVTRDGTGSRVTKERV
jgi:exonuclease SbcC